MTERKQILLPEKGTETILLAEDDPAVRRFTKDALEQWGYKVIEAADGADAIKVFNENKDKIHLLILDVVMPEKSGVEAYEEIRKISPDMKTIFMSGYPADVLHKKGLMDMNFILKPVTPMELLKKVRDVLGYLTTSTGQDA